MKNISQSIKVVILAIVLSFGISYVFAWTAPTLPPTGGNSTAPLNTGATNQSKNGTLVLTRTDGVQGIETYGSAFFATINGLVGIGTANPWAKLTVENRNNPNIIADLSVGNPDWDSSTIAFANSYGTAQATIKTMAEANGSTNFRILTMGQDSYDVLKTRFGVDWSGDVYMVPNVGIGKSSPTEKLDVAGNIKASGTICGSGGCIGGGGGPVYQSAQTAFTNLINSLTFNHNLGYIPVCTWSDSSGFDSTPLGIRAITSTQVTIGCFNSITPSGNCWSGAAYPNITVYCW